MTSQIENEVPTRQAALVGGIAYLIIFVLAIFANFLAIEESVVPRRRCDHNREHHRNPGGWRKAARHCAHVREE